jgi:hypothetical protein
MPACIGFAHAAGCCAIAFVTSRQIFRLRMFCSYRSRWSLSDGALLSSAPKLVLPSTKWTHGLMHPGRHSLRRHADNLSDMSVPCRVLPASPPHLQAEIVVRWPTNREGRRPNQRQQHLQGTNASQAPQGTPLLSHQGPLQGQNNDVPAAAPGRARQQSPPAPRTSCSSTPRRSASGPTPARRRLQQEHVAAGWHWRQGASTPQHCTGLSHQQQHTQDSMVIYTSSLHVALGQLELSLRHL